MSTIAGRIERAELHINSSPTQEGVTALLDIAVEAHGGLARWNEVSSVKIDVSITGAIWYAKGQPDVLKNVVMVARHRARAGHDFVRRPRSSDHL